MARRQSDEPTLAEPAPAAAKAAGPCVDRAPKLAVVIPCYRAAASVRDVVARIGPEAWRIYVVDDACPEASGSLFAEGADPRVRLLSNPRNLGVGGAVKRGYRQALEDGADLIVKLDADGQMDPALLPRLVAPILAGRADYAKGNRFAPAHHMPPVGSASGGRSRPMPLRRRIANNLLSFLHKGVTGYWHILDPANGYTAIHRDALESIALDRVADCYFFETDMLFHLYLAGAVVRDVPLPARYGDEVSSLRVRKEAARFPLLASRRFLGRIGHRYFLQDFNVASLELALGLPLLLAGTAIGGWFWAEALASGEPATAGTVMAAALPIIIGFQLLLSAVSYDVANVPRRPICAPDLPE